MIKLLGFASLAVWLGNTAIIDTSGNIVNYGTGNNFKGFGN